MANQIVVSAGAKVRNLGGVLTATSGVVSSLPINASNGIPQLDVNGKILVSQLPNSVMEYLGVWNAATNTPTLANGTGNQGDVYLCNVAGTVDFGAGPIAFVVGDQVIYSGSIWQRASGATGTVTSVAITESGDSLNITGSPITTSGTINIGFNGTNLQYVNGAGNLTTFPTLITSIGLSMPSAFSVANSPLTANGTIAVTGAGVASQYIRGDGTLADFPSSGGGGSSVSYYLNGGTSQGAIGGTTYYEMSKTAVIGTGVDFTKSGDGFIVAFLTDANDPAQLNIPAGNWNYEIYASMSSNGGTPEMYAELYVYDGTTFTLISTSSNEIIYDGTALNLYTFAMAVPATTLALTDRLAVKIYATNSGGKTTTIHTQDSHLCQVITTFSTGITALNGLTAQVQYFQVGTSGTDFNISSTTATHTFNIPDASATARGLITTGTQTIAGTKTFSDATKNNGGIFLQNASSNSLAGYMNLGGLTNGVKFTSGGGVSNTFTLPSATGYTFTFPNATGTIALTSDLASYVPYTGATTNLDLGINFITSSALKVIGDNSTYGGTLSIKQSNVTNLIGVGYTELFGKTNRLGISFGAGSIAYLSNSTLTAERTYTLPDASGTLALTSDLTGGTVTSVAMTVPTGLSVSGSPITTSGTLAVSLASGYSIPTTSSQATWDTAYSLRITTASLPLVLIGNLISMNQATALQNGFLTYTDFTTFNNKQNALTLTTTGTSGAATLVGATLNIPQYTDAYTGTVTSVAALTIGTTGTDLSSSVANSTTTPVITLNVPTASATNRGALSSADWTTFNNKYNLPSLTSGSVLFSNGSTIAQDNANFFWDDTNNRLGIGTASPAVKLHIIGGGEPLRIESTNAIGGNYVQYKNASGDLGYIGWGSSANNNLNIVNQQNAGITFLLNSTEKMRLDASGNLGLGVVSPLQQLQLTGNILMANSQAIRFLNSASAQRIIMTLDGSDNLQLGGGINNIIFTTNSVEALRITSTGNLGLGVTPSAWASGYNAFQVLNLSLFGTSGLDLNLTSNVYYDGTNYKYISNGYASMYNQYQGKHYWSTVGTGTAGNAISFTQAMTLTAAGNLGIGVTSPTTRLFVQSADADFVSVFKNTNASGYGLQVYTQGSSTNLAFQVRTNNGSTNALQVLDNGNVGIGTISPTEKLVVVGNIYTNGTNTNLYLDNGGAGGASLKIGVIGTTETYINSLDNDPLWFGTNNTERMRIWDSTGNVNIGTTPASDSGYKLDVNGTGRFSGDVSIIKASAASFIANNTSASGKSYRLVSTDAGTFIIQNTGILDLVTITSAGAATFSSSVTATSFFESSDSRLKTLIQDNYQTKGIASITPKLYTKNGKVELGYYAQDLVGILDSAVSKGSDDMLSLSYREVLVAKVYALEQRIKELETKLN